MTTPDNSTSNSTVALPKTAAPRTAAPRTAAPRTAAPRTQWSYEEKNVTCIIVQLRMNLDVTYTTNGMYMIIKTLHLKKSSRN